MRKMLALFCCLALSACIPNNPASPTKFNISKEKMGPPRPSPKYPQNVIKNIALETCKSAVMATLYVPASFEQDVPKTHVKVTKTKGTTIQIPFSA